MKRNYFLRYGSSSGPNVGTKGELDKRTKEDIEKLKQDGIKANNSSAGANIDTQENLKNSKGGNFNPSRDKIELVSFFKIDSFGNSTGTKGSSGNSNGSNPGNAGDNNGNQGGGEVPGLPI